MVQGVAMWLELSSNPPHSPVVLLCHTVLGLRRQLAAGRGDVNS